jgi:aminoglycoside 6'-N-acetyltransferase I
MPIQIHELTDDYFDAWSRMRRSLWGDKEDDCTAAFDDYLRQRPNQAMNLIAVSETGSPVGFIESALRTDYVEGTDASPVWYVEGIFTEEHPRKQGVARALVHDTTLRGASEHL